MVRREIGFEPRPRGLHDVTSEITGALPEIGSFGVGLLHLLLLHTSASLTVTENASPEVLTDLEEWFSDAVPESRAWKHSLEGPDDMPAHVRSALTTTELTLPVEGGRLVLGTWQGIFLFEHRNDGGPRRAVATLWGDGPFDH